MLHIISFPDKYIIADESGNHIAEYGNHQDAINHLQQNEQNIIEYPFYEVDEHGQSIG